MIKKSGIIFMMVFSLICSGYSEDAKTIAKSTMKHQIDLLKKGDLENFKACFTQRQREKITAESMKKGEKGASKYTMDELVHKVIEDVYAGNKTIKIKMANGRTLTTLVLVEGKWLADTIWFK